MTEKSELDIEINLKKAKRDLNSLNKSLDKTTRSGSKASKTVKAAGEQAEKSSHGFGLLKGIVATVFTGAAINSFAKTIAMFETLEFSLGTVFKSMDRGKEVFKDIQTLAEITPFSVEDLTTSVIKLRAAGIEPTTQQLELFSDTASVTTDAVGSLTAITDLFSRTTAGGLGLMDLNRLADRGIPVFDILSEKLGLARLEVVKFGSSAQGSAKILDALTEGLQERFGGASVKSTKLLTTSISNLGDSWDRFLKKIGDNGILDSFTFIVQKASITLDWLGGNLDTVAVGLSGLATLAIPAAIKAVKGLTLAMAANPIGLIVVGISTAVTAMYHFRGVIFDTLIKAWEVWVPNAIDHTLLAFMKIDRGILNVVNSVLGGISDLANKLVSETPDWLKGWLGISDEAIDFTFSMKSFDKAISDLEKQIAERTKNFKAPPRPSFLGLDEETEEDSGAAGLSSSGSLTGDRINKLKEEIDKKALEKKKEREEEERERQRELSIENLDRLEDFLSTEKERLEFSYIERQAMVEDAQNRKLISDTKAYKLEQKLKKKHEKDLFEIEKKGWTERQKFAALSAKQQTEVVISELINLTSGIAQQSRKAFEINKAAGIANALVNTYTGVSKSLSTYPWPLAGIMAASHLAAGLSQVDAIRSASFGGGSGAGSGAPSGVTGGAGATSANTITQQPTEIVQPIQESESSREPSQVSVIIQGDVYDGDGFRRNLIAALEVAQENDEVRFLVNEN